MTDTNSIPVYHFPDDRGYESDNHLWIKSNTVHHQVLIGIDALGLEALGELAYISLPAIGILVQRGESIGMLEAAKMTSDLIAPVSGTLVARNDLAMQRPSIVNDDPYDQGWLVTIEPNNWQAEAAELIQGPEIPLWVEAEVKRYRDQGWID
jgi:glycine cleavage system H protein